MNGESIWQGPVFEDCPVLNRVAVAGVIEDPRHSEFERDPAGLLCQYAGLRRFQRTQVEVLHPKFHSNPGQRRPEMADPSEGIDVGILAFDICGTNATSFDPGSTNSAQCCEVILTVFHQRQVCDERDVYAETR